MPIMIAEASGSSAAIDSGLVSQVISLVRAVMGLFSDYPLNILLVASLCFVGFALFARAKSSAM